MNGRSSRPIWWIVTLATIGVLLYSAISTMLFHFFIIPLGQPPAATQIFLWQFVIWSYWIAVGPGVVQMARRIAGRGRGRLREWSWYLVVLALVLGAHAVWHGQLTHALSPYISHKELGSAYEYYLRSALPIDLLLYAAFVIGVVRSRSFTPSFEVTGEGLLRTLQDGLRVGAGAEDPLVEAMPGPVIVYDPDSLRILAVNHAAVAEYGWPAPEFRTLSLLDIRPPEDVASVRANLMRTRHLPVWRAHSRHRRKDGTVFDIELTNHAVVFHGTWARMLLITDVTAEERARKLLAESERRFREIFENAVVGMFQSTPDGRFIALNSAAAGMLGYDSPEQALREVDDIATQHYVERSDRAKYLEVLEREGSVRGSVCRMRRRDGSPIWVAENSRAVLGPDGCLAYIEGTVKDVSREVESSAALRESERRAAELRIQLANAELRALKLQLKPHFLFNTLNTVAMMIRNGEHGNAQQMVVMLGEVFRYFLEFEGADTVPLARELAFLNLYIGLQQYRFAGRMEVRQDIDEALLEIQLPALILQPLVENAITHGVARSSGPCQIDIAARVENGAMVVEVINDAPTADRSPEPGYGVGIANTEARLREFYGGRASFRLQRTNGRFSSSLRVPL